MSEEERHQEKIAEERRHKAIDRALAMWTHQNTLLWSRTQMIYYIQLPVIGGWWVTRVKCWPAAFGLALLGLILTSLLWRLIHLDCYRRFEYMEKVRELDNSVFATRPILNCLAGHIVMELMVFIFCAIDIFLLCAAW